MTRPKRPLKDELDEVIAILREIAEGRAPIPTDPAVLTPAMLAFRKGEKAIKNPRCTRDDPVHQQLREINRLVASFQPLRMRWKGWMGSHKALAEVSHQAKTAKNDADIEK